VGFVRAGLREFYEWRQLSQGKLPASRIHESQAEAGSFGYDTSHLEFSVNSTSCSVAELFDEFLGAVDLKESLSNAAGVDGDGACDFV
jgi:hypothetical protein